MVISPVTKKADSRGWLTELWRRDELPPQLTPQMAYVSVSHPGVVRGPHEHRYQTDIFCFLGPSTFRLFLWDNRPKSRTYGACCQLDFGEDQPAQVIVPPGVVHAYVNIGTKDGLVFNAPDQLYAGWNRQQQVDEIRHENDPNSPFKVTLDS